ncbi:MULTISPECIES: DUF5615 family PIN-like protein [Bradyrhizobium]|jgi:predicted nuclease of predicted toxin-antitoxin system|uniref:DUF5615 family PIN-like protein n=1 Tax=Bradyrhizobium TaxID=374 RepID=UPI000417D8E6
MRFLIDMNLSPSWVPFLQNAGFEAAHWSAVGAADASDRTTSIFRRSSPRRSAASRASSRFAPIY